MPRIELKLGVNIIFLQTEIDKIEIELSLTEGQPGLESMAFQ